MPSTHDDQHGTEELPSQARQRTHVLYATKLVTRPCLFYTQRRGSRQTQVDAEFQITWTIQLRDISSDLIL